MICTYLLHFDQPIGRSRHYLGSTREGRLDDRMAEHLAGKGSRLTARAIALAVGWTVARTWESSDRSLERKLKRAGHFANLCPLCSRKFDTIGDLREYRAVSTSVPPSSWKEIGWPEPSSEPPY